MITIISLKNSLYHKFLSVQEPTYRLVLSYALRSSHNMATVTTRAQVIIVKPGQTKHDLLNGRIPFNLFPINWKKSNGLPLGLGKGSHQAIGCHVSALRNLCCWQLLRRDMRF